MRAVLTFVAALALCGPCSAAARVRDPWLTVPPAHHQLWLCIHNGEGDWEDGGWPYWGGLQMGSWFLKTYMGIKNPVGRAGANGWVNAPSQLQQEQAAERSYAQSGYAAAWLSSQWPNTVRPCWRFA